MRNSAFFLNVWISLFSCRRFCYPFQKPSGRGDFCVKTKVLADLGNQIRENLCEKWDFGRKCRGVWRKTPKSFLENSFTFGGKRKCVWVQMYLCFGKGVSETSERGKWVKTFEDFRCWNEINYGWNESFFLFCVYLDLVVLYCVIDCFLW